MADESISEKIINNVDKLVEAPDKATVDRLTEEIKNDIKKAVDYLKSNSRKTSNQHRGR